MEIENTFLALEKLDLEIKDSTQKLTSIKSEQNLSFLIQTIQKHFREYQAYLDKLQLYASSDEEKEKLLIKQDQLQLTRSTYNKCLLATKQQLQTNNKNELLYTNSANSNNNLHKRKSTKK